MKKALTIALFVLFTATLFASESFRPEICFTSGECQEKHPLEYANICFKVKTGLDANGNQTCAPQCAMMSFGYTCEKFKDLSYGACKRELTPNYDTSTSTCWGALDPDEAP